LLPGVYRRSLSALNTLREIRRAWRDEAQTAAGRVSGGDFPCLERFSEKVAIPAPALVRGLEVERVFHRRVLEEQDFDRRQALYSDVYEAVHPIYGSVPSEEIFHGEGIPRAHTLWLFERELAGRSILDVGCGRGEFLVGVARSLPHGRLVGLDAVVPRSDPELGIEFRQGNIVRFAMDAPFDVVFSDNVIEHIAPADLDTHLASIHGALKDGGKAIVLTPNRLFGPWDVTRILDDSYTNSVPAQGTHLNEMTHAELAAALRRNGFQQLRTVYPVAKVERRYRTVRFPAALMEWAERVPGLVRLAQGVPDKWRFLPAFEISVIATKVQGPR